VESITPQDIEAWHRSLTGLSNRSKNKLLIQLHGIFRRAQYVWAIPVNPLSRVEKHPMRASGDIQVFSPEEVWALVRAAANDVDAAIFLTAAFTGLRLGELLALCWRDVDFTGETIRVRGSWASGALTTPKSGKVRSVPLAPDVAAALAKLGARENWLGDDDLVFPGEAGGYLDGSALRRRLRRR
jgi:integrase